MRIYLLGGHHPTYYNVINDYTKVRKLEDSGCLEATLKP